MCMITNCSLARVRQGFAHSSATVGRKETRFYAAGARGISRAADPRRCRPGKYLSIPQRAGEKHLKDDCISKRTRGLSAKLQLKYESNKRRVYRAAEQLTG